MSRDPAATARAAGAAVLFDYGGVLTTSVLDAFRDFGLVECGDPHLPLRLLSGDAESTSLLRDLETNRISDAAFEVGFAARLRAFGAPVAAHGLLGRVHERIHPDEQMLRLVAATRKAGYRVGLLSNSMGSATYARKDLIGLFDCITISGPEGVRKPSRRIYEIACGRLGFSGPQVAFVDDLEQNVIAANSLGMFGVMHRGAASTARALEAHLALSPGTLGSRIAPASP